MRLERPAGTTGYLHEAAFFGSDDDLLALAVPFIEDGIDHDEPVVVTLTQRNTELVQSRLGNGSSVTYLPAHYEQPSRSIESFRRLLARHVADGAAQVRVIGNLPHSGGGPDWAPWLRYEGAFDAALTGQPLWAVCAYDTRDTPDDVVTDAECLHAHVVTAAGHRPSPSFGDRATYVRQRLRELEPPADDRPPALTLRDVDTPVAARRAIAAVAAEALLPHSRVVDVVLAANEIVTNALRHGRPPVDVRMWVDGATVTCEVRDSGPGSADPFLGLVPPAPGSTGGYGVWIAHQLCDRVDLLEHGDGFVVRLVVDGARR